MNKEELNEIANALNNIARAITPLNAMPYKDGESVVASLTEAIIFLAEQSKDISHSLGGIEAAIDELKEEILRK